MQDASNDLDEMGRLLRAMRSTRIFKARAFTWRTDIDPSELGPLLMDDRITVDISGLHYSVFLYESMLLCCVEGVDDAQVEDEHPRYPVRAWELGPALKGTTPLNLVHAIPTNRLKVLRCDGSGMYICSILVTVHNVG